MFFTFFYIVPNCAAHHLSVRAENNLLILIFILAQSAFWVTLPCEISLTYSCHGSLSISLGNIGKVFWFFYIFREYGNRWLILENFLIVSLWGSGLLFSWKVADRKIWNINWFSVWSLKSQIYLVKVQSYGKKTDARGNILWSFLRHYKIALKMTL